MNARLHHTQLAAPAGSEDQMRRFYVGVVGMNEVAKPATLAKRGGIWVRGGELELHLGVEEDFRPARKAHPGILLPSHADQDELAQRLTSAGAPVIWDDGFPGYRGFYSEDPFGNRLEFLALA